MTPDNFWNSTFDEVLLVIQGKVDDWRLARRAAWKIVEGFRGSQDMPDEVDFYSLPYDSEIKKEENLQQQESLEDWHKIASQELSIFNWPSKKN